MKTNGLSLQAFLHKKLLIYGTYMHVYTCVCVCACVRACVCACACVCVCVRIFE